MTRAGRFTALALVIVASIATGTEVSAEGNAKAATVHVFVPNARAVRGIIHVDVCSAADFLKLCPYSAEAKVTPGGTEIVVQNVPLGHYAVQLFHDENGNHKVDRGLFGIPKEGVGFSNNFRISTRAPRFSDAEFTVGGGGARMTISLQYF